MRSGQPQVTAQSPLLARLQKQEGAGGAKGREQRGATCRGWPADSRAQTACSTAAAAAGNTGHPLRQPTHMPSAIQSFELSSSSNSSIVHSKNIVNGEFKCIPCNCHLILRVSQKLNLLAFRDLFLNAKHPHAPVPLKFRKETGF